MDCAFKWNLEKAICELFIESFFSNNLKKTLNLNLMEICKLLNKTRKHSFKQLKFIFIYRLLTHRSCLTLKLNFFKNI